MKKTTEQFVQEVFAKWGIKVTSDYLGAHGKVYFTCTAGHSNEAIATNLLQRGYKCKECLVGRKVVPKITWIPKLIDSVLEDLESNTTEYVAEKYSTTVSAIHNMLHKHDLDNPRDRLSIPKVKEVLELQDRTFINSTGCFVTSKCKNEHITTQELSNVLHKNTGCPKCISLGVSRAETELREYIESVYKGWIIYNDRDILSGKGLDIVLPDLGLAIEYNGTYWHSEEHVGKTYHKSKTDSVESIDFQLLHIKDYDWVNKPDIVKSIISSKLGITTKIFARKTTIKKIPFPRDFLNINHIQGAGQPTSINYGLYTGEELVAVATFGKPRFSNEAELELIRFCSKLNTTVVGGLSKLLSQVKSSVLTYANRDYSIGRGYKSVGFKHIRNTEPSFEYYKRHNKISRYKAQSMTKEELIGYYKYYNSGNMVLIRT